LSAKNKITANGALAVLVLRHSFGIINLRLEEIRKIDRKTRKVLTMYKMHHPNADIDRLYVKRIGGGGRGLLQTAVIHKAKTINPLAPELNPPPPPTLSTLMAVQPFKGLTARHIYIYICRSVPKG